MNRRNTMITLLWAGIAALWIVYLAVMMLIYVTHEVNGGDFLAYYKAANSVLRGELMYFDILGGKAFLYPPLLAQLVAPVVTLVPDYKNASAVWYVINGIALVAATGVMVREMQTRRARLITAILPIFYIPTFHNFLIGQVSILLFALMVGGWAAYRRDRPVLAGVLLAAAAWIKVYPVLLVVYFLYKRDWRVMKGVVIASIGFVAFQIAVSGLENFAYYFLYTLPELTAEGQLVLSHGSHSILGFAQKLFIPAVYVIPLVDNAALVTPVRWLLSLMVCGVFVALTAAPWRTWNNTSKSVFDLEYAMIVTISLLLGATLGLHGAMSMLLVVVVLLQTAARGELMQVGMRCFLAVCLINVHLLITMQYSTPQGGMALPWYWLSTPTFGMFLLFIQNSIALRRLKSSNAVVAQPAATQSLQTS